jgi:protein phosphatase
MSSVSDEDTVEEVVGLSLEERAARLFGSAAQPVQVEIGARSHPGKVRPNNEDHYLVVRRRRSRDVLATNLPEAIFTHTHDDAYGLVVADGVGGAAFGELASMLALSTGWNLTTGAFKWHFNVNEREAEEIMETLRIYGQLMHRRLLEERQADPRLDAFVAHAGDSRAYLFHNGALKRLTRDHTLAQKLVDQGKLKSVADATGFMRNLLVNCLGRNAPEVQVDTCQIRLGHGDELLLCTDGLTDMVPEPEIARIVAGRAEPEAAVRDLVDAALEAGGKDNITVVLARFLATPEGN